MLFLFSMWSASVMASSVATAAVVVNALDVVFNAPQSNKQNTNKK
jgi:hypothetical protein